MQKQKNKFLEKIIIYAGLKYKYSKHAQFLLF